MTRRSYLWRSVYKKVKDMEKDTNDDLKWILCPRCRNKTRTKVRDDTVLENFPLYCPKCKGEFLISLKNSNIVYLNKPDD